MGTNCPENNSHASRRVAPQPANFCPRNLGVGRSGTTRFWARYSALMIYYHLWPAFPRGFQHSPIYHPVKACDWLGARGHDNSRSKMDSEHGNYRT